ncbi:hypothetical protein [uncultured Sphingomonas sp.]|uniref:hypothetical protein n=1 Tax=uncultured Sphingomonas sp. TaxID=158754 RepID=UPI0035CA8E26
MMTMLGGVALAAPGKDPAPLVLAGDGLAAGGKTLKFDRTAKAQAIAIVTVVRGKPLKLGNHGDCGQGDEIGFATFAGGLELSFVKGKLSGWTVDEGGDARLRTARGIGLGSTLAAVRKAYPDVDIEDFSDSGGPGPSFQREGGPNGFLNGKTASARVTDLWAGATCMAGI